jgi:hypothetical protein
MSVTESGHRSGERTWDQVRERRGLGFARN